MALKTKSPEPDSQFRRISPAEGYERNSDKEIANFLNYAKGSAGELRTQLYIAIEINYIERDAGRKWIQEAEEISKMLHGLIKSIRSRDQ